MKRLFCTLIVFSTMVRFADAQQKLALFLHGYDSNGKVGWLNSGTPQALVNQGVIDNYWAPDLPLFTDVNALSNTLSNVLSQGEGQKWVFVGHSLGGLVARGVESNTYRQTLLQPFNIQLKGIVTMGTPHQGCPAAVNYSNAPTVLQSFANDVLAGPQFEHANGGIVDAILSAASYWTLGQSYYQFLSNTMTTVETKIQQMVANAAGQGADAMTPGSSFITALQYIPAQAPHVSVSGVENSPSLIRWAPTLDTFAELLGSNPPPEDEVVSKFYDAKNDYNSLAEYHLYLRDFYGALYWACPWSCDNLRDSYYYHKDARDAWGRGWWAMNGIDDTWFQLHNEYLSTSTTVSYEHWVTCDAGGGGTLPSVQQLEALFKAYNPCDYGASGYWQTDYYTYTYYYADRSDGFIPVNRTKWYGGDAIVSNPSTDYVSQVSQSDVNFDGTGEADGGYNHGELRDLTRRYGQHGTSKPMDYGKAWIKYWINR